MTFEIALRQRGQLRDPAALRAWLLCIEVREAVRARWDASSGDIDFDNPDGTTESLMDGTVVELGG